MTLFPPIRSLLVASPATWVLIGFLVTGCGPTRQATQLRLAHSLDPSHPVHQAMEFLAEDLAKRSQGQMTITLYPSSQLGSEREMIELLQLGAIDMVKTSSAPLEGFIPGMAVFGIPYLFRDEDHFWRVLKGEIGQKILASGLDKRLQGLCYYEAGSRSFYTKSKPIHHPKDLQGLKIRVQNSRAAIQLMEALGAAATPLSFSELYSALDQGVVDGAENNPPSFLTSRHSEICHHYTLDEHTRVPDIVLISPSTWNRLTDQQQTWLKESADASVKFQRNLWDQKTQETFEQLQTAGVEIIHPDKKPFQEAVQSLYQSYQGTEAGHWMEAILNHP